MARNNKNRKPKHRKYFNKKFTSSTGDAVINNYFRRHLTEWRQASLEEYNSKCIITHTTEDLDIHHLNVTFKDIVEEAHTNLNIKPHKTLVNYSIVDLALLKDEILRLHFLYGLGVPISRKLHKQYHNIYKEDINATTFHEFANNYKKNEKIFNSVVYINSNDSNISL